MNTQLQEFKYAAQIQEYTYNMEMLLQIRGRIEQDNTISEESKLNLIGMCELRMEGLYKRMSAY